ncbi:MAG: TonB family protein [Pseudomonadota bacterium]
MIRLALSALGGSALALALFWLLALLVMPPAEKVTPPQMTMPLRLAAVAEVATEPAMTPGPAPESAAEPQAPDAAPVEPDPVPDPIPEPEPLSEPDPEPEPLPEPDPEPEPRLSPEPQARPAPRPEPAPVAGDMSRDVPTGGPDDGDADSVPGSADSGPVEVGEAVPLSRVPPRYPRRAQRRGVEGYVELEFLIQPDGRVDRASLRVLDARPTRVFEAAAEQAVGEWRFEADGRLRRARQRLEFRLR